ncbi:hypothetical protein G6F23_013762 [Rhizopus arrhizus]|nr:hypothetical protein G6F23_013762 [Rhizopus arrhizus]
MRMRCLAARAEAACSTRAASRRPPLICSAPDSRGSTLGPAGQKRPCVRYAPVRNPGRGPLIAQARRTIAAAGQTRCRGRQPGQDRVPHHDEPRDPNAAIRHPRHAGTVLADPCQPPTGAVSRNRPAIVSDVAAHDQRHAGPLPHRSRPHRVAVRAVLAR